jgi:hypothetical protein
MTIKERAGGKVLLDNVLNLNNGRGISFSRDGNRIALPMNDNTVQIFDLR